MSYEQVRGKDSDSDSEAERKQKESLTQRRNDAT